MAADFAKPRGTEVWETSKQQLKQKAVEKASSKRCVSLYVVQLVCDSGQWTKNGSIYVMGAPYFPVQFCDEMRERIVYPP